MRACPTAALMRVQMLVVPVAVSRCIRASLTVTDDELALAMANGHHGVNGLQASLT